MSRHDAPSSYYLVGEGFEPTLPPEAPLHTEAFHQPDPSAHDSKRDEKREFKFGRLFPRRVVPDEQAAAEVRGLKALGQAMNNTPNGEDSTIPAGYTYLGQFLTHEITFDETEDLATDQIEDLSQVEQGRSPSIDLDSVYGRGPTDCKHGPLFYEDHARLKEGRTFPVHDCNRRIPYDLLRGAAGSDDIKAVIPDRRNDENLAIAQTHLAFIKFHNKVVDDLPKSVPEAEQFKAARKTVVRHFQWIVLRHFLPRVIDPGVLECVERSAKAYCGPKFFKPSPTYGLFMPVEFSAAAFRFGHSMVRKDYQWNYFHHSPFRSPMPIMALFRHTGFSGNLGGLRRLAADRVIDWRRLYDFREAGLHTDGPDYNRAKRIGTGFSFKLNEVLLYPHTSQQDFRPLPVRNLIRGFTLGLPTGQDVARTVGITPMTPDEVAAGPHEALLREYSFHERTPLWYYVLKEAERGGGSRLGPVGSRLVAETLVGIIMHSDHSILRGKCWRPHIGPRASQGIFDMVDLLHYIDFVNPVGKA